jgi:uncharacterized protein (TIGR03437 family)
VVNAASNRPGAVSPGEVVTLYGSGLLGTQSVLFNGVPAPLLYSTDTQVGAVVPYALTASNFQIVAQAPGGASAPLPGTLSATAPGIFTADSSGSGQASAMNQDGSPNAPGTPATTGSIISFFATGEGQTTPAGIDGKLGSTPLPQPLQQVTVTIGGVPADVKYAGGVQRVIAGVMQVNAVVPSGATGAVSVTISVGGITSQPGVTLSVSSRP